MTACDIGERFGMHREQKPGISAHSFFDECIREKIESSPLLKMTKAVFNSLLSVTRLGATMKALYRKPEANFGAKVKATAGVNPLGM